MSLLFEAIDSGIFISCLRKTKYEVYNLSSKSATFETLAVIYGLRYYSSLEYAQRRINDVLELFLFSGWFFFFFFFLFFFFFYQYTLSLFIWIFELKYNRKVYVCTYTWKYDRKLKNCIVKDCLSMLLSHLCTSFHMF